MNAIHTLRSSLRALAWAAVIPFVLLHARAATFTVSSTADTTDPGTLRNAITQANGDTTTPRVINFNIPGGGVQTIAVATALPPVANAITIDGTTQPGYAGLPLIVIDGSGTVDGDGLAVDYRGDFTAGPVFRGLCIIRFGTAGGVAGGHGINIIASDSATVTGCHIGIDAAGTTAKANRGAGIRHGSASAVPAIYGGSTAAERNVISGNLGPGVQIEFSFANVIGNYIGTSASGVNSVPNGGDGVLIKTNTATSVKIGTSTSGQGNLISGNIGNGVHVLKRNATVQGNTIGLAVDGATALGNAQHGVLIEVEAGAIGETTAGAGNVISSNGGDGVRVDTLTNASIRGNRIGTDSTGMFARGNGGYGVNFVASSATATNSVNSNLISANGSGGVRITAGKMSCTGNMIGVSVNASAKLGNNGDGVAMTNVVSSPGTQNDFGSNTIGGNAGAGISIGANSNDLFVKNNFIGTNSNSANLGNTGPGIRITGATNTTIGDFNNRNTIAFNGGDGIEMDGNNNVAINSIHDNGGLAIDILPNGQNAATSGGELNVPVITDRTINGSDVTITFTHDAKASTSYQAQFYSNTAGDPSGFGEMETYLGSSNWTTNGSGHFEGIATFTLPSPALREATAAGSEPVFVILINSSTGGSFAVLVSAELSKYFPGVPMGPAPTSGTNGTLSNSLNSNEPINTFTGELFDLESVDLNLRGPMPLFFARYYASLIESDGQISSALGRNRLHNFDAKLKIEAANVTAVLSSGRVMQFTGSDGKWVLAGPLDVAFQLVQSGQSFILADPRSQKMWTFDATGTLTKIEDGRGNVHSLSYTDGKLSTVSDGLGRMLTFAYDAGNHLTGVTDGTRSIAFTYSGSDLATASDALNHMTSYTYDGSDHLLSWQRPRGDAPYVQTYASERVASQTEQPDGTTMNPTALAYDTNTHATTITDPTGEQRIHVHNDIGLGTRFTDEEGKSVVMTYDANQRRDSVTDRIGRVTKLTYHLPSGKPAAIVEPDGATTTLTYTSRNLSGITFYDLTKVTFADGTINSFSYDANGNVLTATDELGQTSSFTYDTHGRVLSATNRTGGVMSFTYDPLTENLATSTDNDSGIGATSYTFDAFSRLTKLTHPDATHLDIVYDDADRIASITDERGNTFAYTYDANDNVTIVTDPAGKMTTLGYDALDRVTQLTDRLGKSSSQTFDTRDWVASATDENSHTMTMVHDTRQRLASMTNAGNATTSFGYNDEAELTSVTDPLGHTTSLVLNKRGRFIASSDALGHTAEFQRDLLQRITNMIDPIGRATTWVYDKRGLLIGAARDGIGAASYTRDAAGRLLTITDVNQGVWSFDYSAVGRLSARKDPVGNTTGFLYDTRGRLATVMRPEGGTCTIARNEASDVTQLAYTGGPTLDYTYDTLRRPTGATGVALTLDAERRITNSQQAGVNFSATYDDAGRLTSVGYNNNAFVVTYSYDSRDRLVLVSDNDPSGQNSVAFTYDEADRATSVTRSNGVNATLTYDNADRLTRILDGTFLDLKYTLNADGDITATDMTAPLLPAVPADAKSFTFDKASQVNATGFTYDARGRLTAMPGHTFAWDGASRLITLDGTALGYDGFGDMITRGTTRNFYHHAIAMHPLVAEQVSGQFTRYYVWIPIGTLLYSVDVATGAPSFYHYDRVGSTLALTNGAGAVTDTYAYTPYGEPLGHGGTPGTSTQPFTFVGALGIRAEGAFYHMRARYYDPLTARFLSRDRVPPRLYDPRMLDPYFYALGNPLRYVDTNGAVEGEYPGSLYTKRLEDLNKLYRTDDNQTQDPSKFTGRRYEGGSIVGYFEFDRMGYEMADPGWYQRKEREDKFKEEYRPEKKSVAVAKEAVRNATSFYDPDSGVFYELNREATDFYHREDYEVYKQREKLLARLKAEIARDQARVDQMREEQKRLAGDKK